MSEFRCEAGTIYTEQADDLGRWDVWFEDFCIIGCGATEAEALVDANRCLIQLSQAITGARAANAGASGE